MTQEIITQILHDNVTGILCSGESCLYHSESCLHKEYKCSSDQEPDAEHFCSDCA